MTTSTRLDQPASAIRTSDTRRLGPTGSGGAGPEPAVAVLLAIMTLTAAAGFERVFVDRQWILPVAAVILAVHGGSWVTRRLALPTWSAPVVGVVLTVVVAAWTVVGATTVAGLPLAGTWDTIAADLGNAWRVLPTVTAPVSDLAGFRLMAAWGGGLIAILGEWAAFRLRSSLQALSPAFGLFVVCCVLGTTAGRLWAVLAVVASMTLFVLVHRNTLGRAGTVWFAGGRHGSVGWSAGVGAGVLALLGAAIVVPNLSPAEGRGVLGWKHGAAGSGGARSVVSPIVDLRTRLVSEAQTPVMTVTSPVSSYWRLTSLDTFTGVQWQSTNSYLGVGHRLPGVGALPANARQVNEHFHLQTLDSIWLPAAFNPESVSGGGRVTYDPVSGSLLTDRPTANNLTYDVTSLQYLDTLNPRALQAAPPPPTDGSLAHDLALPPLPPAIRQLALKITSARTTEYDKAMALQNFFYGPSFHYSLDPPSDGYGTDALANFLFSTRTGYCQQFAGAFAVMARSIGLPTRLAIGFTPGQPIGPDRYQVTDANAHTWPEVYFSGFGWLPFEPTRGGFEVPGATGYTGATAAAASAPPTTVSTTAPVTPASGPGQSSGPAIVTPDATPNRAITAPVRPRAGSHPSAINPALAGLFGVLGAGAAWASVVSGARRWRWGRRWRRAGSGPDAGAAQVLALWAETEELLASWGIRRRVEETFAELAGRAGGRVDRLLAARSRRPPRRSAGAGDASLGSDLEALATWAGEAGFAGGAMPSAAVAGAQSAHDKVAERLRRGVPIKVRLRWWADPGLARRGPRPSEPT